VCDSRPINLFSIRSKASQEGLEGASIVYPAIDENLIPQSVKREIR
jgi:hypothetical protein